MEKQSGHMRLRMHIGLTIYPCNKINDMHGMHGMAILSSLDYVPTVRPAGIVIHTSEAIITASVNVALYTTDS